MRPAVRATWTPVALCIAACAAYLLWTPSVPDLAAQIARTQVIQAHGPSSWWTGWFGGLVTTDYSVLVPSVMAAIGVGVTGALAAVTASAATVVLTRDAPRRRLAALTGAVTILANLIDGRVTFGVGVALAAWALVALRARQPVVGGVLAVGTYLASPLAGLFLGMIALAAVVTVASLRWAAVALAVILAALALIMLIYFPTTGSMPFHVVNAIPPALCCAAVLIVCPSPTIRWAAAITLLAIVLFLNVTTPVGTNVCRVVWLCALPAVAGYGRLRGPRPVQALVAVVALIVGIYPVADVVGQIGRASAASTRADFYRPLTAELRALIATDSTTRGQRVEIVDPASHWESVHLPDIALARGWDRQADHANNPLFYGGAALTSDAYHSWLHQLAVGWVGLPATRLDYASRAEGALVAAGLPYLRPVWRNANWQLFAVTDATALLEGADLVSVGASSVTLQTTKAATVRTRVRWSPYLRTTDTTGHPTASCLLRAGDWTNVYLPRAETVVLSSRFVLSGPISPARSTCVATLSGG